MDYGVILRILAGRSLTSRIDHPSGWLRQSRFWNNKPKVTTPSFLSAYPDYTSFAPTHLEHLQDTVVLHWSPYLEAFLYRCINGHEVAFDKCRRIRTVKSSTTSHLDVIPLMGNPKLHYAPSTTHCSRRQGTKHMTICRYWPGKRR